MTNFADLDYREFELLVGLLLAREGFQITRTPRDGRDFGVDFEALTSDGALVFVEAKHFQRSERLPASVLDHFAGELQRLRKQYTNAHGILVTSGKLTDSAKSFTKTMSRVAVWDGPYVQTLLRKHVDVWADVEQAKTRRQDIIAKLESLKSPNTGVLSFSAKLSGELQSVLPGRESWKLFEELGARALTELFGDSLGAPDLQSRSEDGLDIMDAVFPIRATIPPWSLVRAEYQSRFVVAEFKNYQESIGQKQVESIQQYLWKKAHRSFGLLVSRKGPDKSALAARRRAWVEHDKLIVLLEDEDLIDMAQLWEEDEGPFQVIEAQLEDFFRRLSP